jgi:hypothetical protein
VIDPTAERAKAVAWCQAREEELSEAVRSLPGAFVRLPFKQYGADCRRAQSYAISLKAADLIPQLGATTLGDEASLSEALRQVQLLANWLAETEPTDVSKGSGEQPTTKQTPSLPWEDYDASASTPQTRKILRHMHGRENADLHDFVEAVWGADLVKVNEGAIDTAISRANSFLAKSNHGRRLERVRGEPIVRWV